MKTKFFIIPFRDRYEIKELFINHMKVILKDEDVQFIFVHQNDTRHFNRGALLNIGFLFLKKKFPNNYKTFNCIFHDIHVIPFKKGIFDYQTKKGIIKHYYGVPWTIGGICCIKGEDYEKCNGYPNYWGWGYEDNKFARKIKEANITIDRKQFLKLNSKKIIRLTNGSPHSLMKRHVNTRNSGRFVSEENNFSGIDTIKNISYKENIFNDHIFLDINSFTTEVHHTKSNINYIRTPKIVPTFKKYIPKSEKNLIRNRMKLF